MTAVSVSSRGGAAIKEGPLRLNLDQHGQFNKNAYKTIPQIQSSRTEDLQRQVSRVSGFSERTLNRNGKYITSTGFKENSFLSDDGSLTFRSLPPIKISIRQGMSKALQDNKIIESPQVESSGIFQPSYSMKTHRPGHRVFTEGISQISTRPSPTFALKNMQVPYSNLPDSVSIHKEKNRFTFGIKFDTDIEIGTSPYRLSEKPMGLGTELMDYLGDSFKGKNKKERNKDGKNKIKDKEPVIKDGNGFNCKLAPNETATRKEVILDYPYAEGYEPVIDSYGNTENVESSRKSRSPTKKANPRRKERERSLSVVSIGDSVTPTFFDRAKRNTRKHYPMYDWKATQNEALTKSKFGVRDVNCAQSSTNKINKDKTKFERSNTRLSTTLLEFDIEELKNKHKSNKNSKAPSTRQKTKESLYESDPEFDLNKIYNTKKGRYQLRKIYPKFRKRFNRPSSNDSNSSTDISTVINNPPPSEISHSMMEDLAVYGTIDPKLEMVTLTEERERTKTASALSVTNVKVGPNKVIGQLSGSFDKGIVPVTQGLGIGNIVKTEQNKMTNANVVHRASVLPVQTGSGELCSASNNINNNLNETSVPNANKNDDNKFMGVNNIGVTDEQSENIESDANDDRMSKDKFKQDLTTTDESDGSDIYGFQRTRMISDFEKTIMEEYREDPGELQNVSRNMKMKNKSNHTVTIPIPTVALDKLSHHPLFPYNPNSVSLSRSLQKTQPGVPVSRKMKPEDAPETNSVIINDGESAEKILSIPVTQIQLYSPATSRSLITPAVSLTDEFGGYQQVFIPDEDVKPDSDKSDKKQLVNSTNISFTSPLVTEPKAKRQ